MSRDPYLNHRNVIPVVALHASPEIGEKLWKAVHALKPDRLDLNTARRLIQEAHRELRAENTPESIALAEKLGNLKKL
jgi:hypothetical protein